MKLVFCFLLVFLAGCGGAVEGTDDNRPPKRPDEPQSLFSLEATSNIQSPNSPIGLWESGELSKDQKVSIKIRIQLSEKETVSASKCAFPGELSLIAQVESPSEISENRLIIAEDKEDMEAIVTGGKSLQCRANLYKTTKEQVPTLNIVGGLMKLEGQSNVVFRKIGN